MSALDEVDEPDVVARARRLQETRELDQLRGRGCDCCDCDHASYVRAYHYRAIARRT